MRWVDLTNTAVVPSGRWALVYATVDQKLPAVLPPVAARMRGGAVFGCTSSGGVFTPRGFERGAFALIGEDGDAAADAVLRPCRASQARRAASEAAATLVARLGRKPDALLLHATPGFEERLLDGIADAFDGAPPPAYGGSAADDDLSGVWKIFANADVAGEGFVLAAFASARPVRGAFVAGYVPGPQRGTVTRAQGRVVHEIDRQPAAEVYNRWCNGALDAHLKAGGVVLADTTLRPVGRVIDRVGNVPRYLLSHPHEVRPDGALSLFTEVSVGDELVLMLGSEGSLMERTEHAVSRALAGERGSARLDGGILIYCGGCVMALGDKAREVGPLFAKSIGQAPFIGAATFGETGCFTGPTPVNRHGNLMCDTVLFG